MHLRGCIISVTLLFAISVACQHPSPRSNGRPPSIEDALRSHNIELTRPAVVEALRNADPEVRSLAAHKLAQDDAKEAVPAITAALTAEMIPAARANLGYALAKLGEPKGVGALQGVCEAQNAPSFVRLEAARLMLGLGQENAGCLDALVDLMEHGDADSRQTAGWLLPQFHNLSPQDSDKVFRVVVGALAAKEPAVRHAASHALGEIGNAAAIAHLQIALAGEKDESVRAEMDADLQKISRKKEQ